MNDYDDYLEVIDEIKKIDIIRTPRYRMCCYSFLDLLKAVCCFASCISVLLHCNGLHC